MFEANYQTFNKLLEIKFNNNEKFNLEFSFDNSGTAKIKKKNNTELNEPKKIKKIISLKTLLLPAFRKLKNNFC